MSAAHTALIFVGVATPATGHLLARPPEHAADLAVDFFAMAKRLSASDKHNFTNFH
jgi:hypothetical protein